MLTNAICNVTCAKLGFSIEISYNSIMAFISGSKSVV